MMSKIFNWYLGLIDSNNLVILNFGTPRLIYNRISPIIKKLECSRISKFLSFNLKPLILYVTYNM